MPNKSLRPRQRCVPPTPNQSEWACGPHKSVGPEAPRSQELRRVLWPQEAAAHMGISIRTLANWRWRGVGPAFVKLGEPRGRGAVRYEAAAIEGWLAAHRRAG